MNVILVAGIHLYTKVRQQLHTNHWREGRWRNRDTTSLETLEISGVIFWEPTLGIGPLSFLIQCTTLVEPVTSLPL